MKQLITSIFTVLALLVPARAVVTLPFGTATFVSSQAYVTAFADPDFLYPSAGTFSVTFRLDASQDVFLSRPGLQHWTEFLRATPWPGIYEIFVEANPSRAFLGFPSNPSDTADWLYVAEGSSRTFQTLGHLPSVPTNYSGGYSFHLRGLRWAEDTAGPSSLATFPGSEMKTDSLYLYAAGTPEPSRTMLAFAGLCAAGLRRRR
ncbi:MAG TPA: hypothetical protein VJJ47_02495 [Candidatus Paceibacterota bacterium]